MFKKSQHNPRRQELLQETTKYPRRPPLTEQHPLTAPVLRTPSLLRRPQKPRDP